MSLPVCSHGGARLGLVLGRFLPPHLGHYQLIQLAQANSHQVTVVLRAERGEPIPARRRAEMLRRLHPNVKVVLMPSHAAENEAPRERAERIRQLLGFSPSLVFSSNSEGGPLASHLGAHHVFLDPLERQHRISSRNILADPWANQQHLAPLVRAWYTVRICVVGAESTGKTTLVRDLATRYRASWVPEYGRAFTQVRVSQSSTIDWHTEDFANIASQQQADEDAAAQDARKLLFCDTDALTTSVWHERMLGYSSDELGHLARSRTYALYILTRDDVPYEYDGVRDAVEGDEFTRPWMTQRLRELLEDRQEPWIEVAGTRTDRLEASVRKLTSLLK